MAKIAVRTPSAKYEVLVGAGLLASLSLRLDGIAPERGGTGAPGQVSPRCIFVLTSTEIWALWSERFLESFKNGGRQSYRPNQALSYRADELPCALFLPPGERYKRLAEVARLAEEMAAAGADRSSLLIAFGGGIVGDVAGFLAAIYMRGIDYIQIPTTLLSQVDSSIGGKTGVNLAAGKNLIGSFHHPLAVFADTDLLQTLPERELRAGLFESVKAGVIRDATLFRFMEGNVEAILGREPKALERVIADSVRMKAEVVGIDERESGLRMILNFGHTLGHAIESATGYDALLHGEAVAWGMLAATHLGLMRGTITEAEADRIVDLIFAFGPLPTFSLGSRPGPAAARLVAAAGRDKKNRAGVRRFVLPSGIGNAVVVEDVTDAEMLVTAEWLVRAASSNAKAGEILSEPRHTAAKATPAFRPALRERPSSRGRQ